jgi:hypothetical protein
MRSRFALTLGRLASGLLSGRAVIDPVAFLGGLAGIGPAAAKTGIVGLRRRTRVRVFHVSITLRRRCALEKQTLPWRRRPLFSAHLSFFCRKCFSQSLRPTPPTGRRVRDAIAVDCELMNQDRNSLAQAHFQINS